MLILTLTLMMAAAEPAAGTPPSPPARAKTETTVQVVRNDPNRKICREELKPNSRFGRKVCKTAAQWDTRSETAQAALSTMQGRTQTQSCDPSVGC